MRFHWSIRSRVWVICTINSKMSSKISNFDRNNKTNLIFVIVIISIPFSFFYCFSHSCTVVHVYGVATNDAYIVHSILLSHRTTLRPPHQPSVLLTKSEREEESFKFYGKNTNHIHPRYSNRMLILLGVCIGVYIYFG